MKLSSLRRNKRFKKNAEKLNRDQTNLNIKEDIQSIEEALYEKSRHLGGGVPNINSDIESTLMGGLSITNIIHRH